VYFFTFKYSGNRQERYAGIVKAEYDTANQTVIVQEDQIFNHKFPIGVDMHLLTEKHSYIVSGKNLESIEIFKPENI
jgi:hypothetical protein